ncbi:RNA 2',3'-cyclic phosphodiesterase [Psychromonas sp.]|uniref:RNA 2',3'-cyclic phosphodiesterase n=1 Tax=Psychromonas sp. TaxID=1884585 RepID=UPI0035613B76
MTKRLFLGIALNKQQAKQISQVQAKLDKSVRLIPIQNLHMTLAFLGLVSEEVQKQLEEQVSLMSKPQFQQRLTTLTYWQKPQVLCLTGEDPEPALSQLARECHSLTYLFNLQKNAHIFTPHITIARKAKSTLQEVTKSIVFKPLVLSPTVMHLYHSQSTENGVNYHILRSWQLK